MPARCQDCRLQLETPPPLVLRKRLNVVLTWQPCAVNSNIHIPFTDWQLELRLRAVDGSLAAPGSIQDFSTQHPISAKLYSIGVLCSPRVTLLWGRLFDNRMLQLLHEHVDEQQVGRNSIGDGPEQLV